MVCLDRAILYKYSLDLRAELHKVQNCLIAGFFLTIEGNSVKALIHCKLENMKKLIEPSFFLELSNIRDKFFHIPLGRFLGLW